MRRQRFIVPAGAAMAAPPRVAGAHAAKRPRNGVLAVGAPNPAPFLKTLRVGLRLLGDIEGRNIHLKALSADGVAEHLDVVAASLVESKIDKARGLSVPQQALLVPRK